MFAHTRPVSWTFIALFLVVQIVFSLVTNFVIFASDVFDPIIKATQGLINITLIANLIGLVLIPGILFLLVARLRPANLGLLPEKVGSGVLVTLLIWGLAQVFGLIAALTLTGEAQISSHWSQSGTPFVLGLLAGQLFGNALLEEIEFRGFLLPQLYHRLRIDDRRRKLALAILLSTLIFTLLHLPNRIAMGYSVAEFAPSLAFAALFGFVFCAIYISTGNLFIATGVHALVNAPTMLVDGTIPGVAFIVLASIVVLALSAAVRRASRPPSVSPQTFGIDG